MGECRRLCGFEVILYDRLFENEVVCEYMRRVILELIENVDQVPHNKKYRVC